jgi:hypothetical protein
MSQEVVGFLWGLECEKLLDGAADAAAGRGDLWEATSGGLDFPARSTPASPFRVKLPQSGYAQAVASRRGL